jgi:hypothetical protein
MHDGPNWQLLLLSENGGTVAPSTSSVLRLIAPMEMDGVSYATRIKGRKS